MNSQNFGLRAKLVAMTIATVIALGTLLTVLLFNERSQLMSDRQDKVRNLVEVAYSSLVFYEKQARDGKMSVEDAKKAALGVVKEARYDKNEYFWINGLDDVMIMHPIKPDMDGKKLDQLKDKNGKLLFVEFNTTVKAKGAGFVDYVWPKPGSEAPIPKISYVKGFEPWGWVIGSGIYVDDVDAKFRENVLHFLIWGILIGGFIAGSLALVSRNIIRTLGGEPADAAAITRRIASGDLTTEVKCRPGDTESLLASIRTMQETLRSMIGTITQNAHEIAGSAT
ncbi:MAG: cache domain-containing protein, partial [Actinomycetota bacterium]